MKLKQLGIGTQKSKKLSFTDYENVYFRLINIVIINYGFIILIKIYTS